EIQSNSLAEIAKFSAKHAFSILHSPCFVEDAGIFISALNGFPGPYSKFVFMTIGNAGVLKLLEGTKNRDAKFISAVGYCDGSEPKVFLGSVAGKISRKPRGTSGFGFDPIFIPEGGDGKTFGEMSVEEKNAFSHRAKAVEAFLKWFKKKSTR
ncbi:MAG: RdgB/HAM1 family non-canonical purine NTP pyrophosphatase, partial [Candidatus Hadarchaeales archaeon]